ncbi:hypothetical protein J3459_014849 [Metarhizium acridum]|nr:hypothetical protein J3459_014849 [Metarhizium acridum]
MVSCVTGIRRNGKTSLRSFILNRQFGKRTGRRFEPQHFSPHCMEEKPGYYCLILSKTPDLIRFTEPEVLMSTPSLERVNTASTSPGTNWPGPGPRRSASLKALSR